MIKKHLLVSFLKVVLLCVIGVIIIAVFKKATTVKWEQRQYVLTDTMQLSVTVPTRWQGTIMKSCKDNERPTYVILDSDNDKNVEIYLKPFPFYCESYDEKKMEQDILDRLNGHKPIMIESEVQVENIIEGDFKAHYFQFTLIPGFDKKYNIMASQKGYKYI